MSIELASHGEKPGCDRVGQTRFECKKVSNLWHTLPLNLMNLDFLLEAARQRVRDFQKGEELPAILTTSHDRDAMGDQEFPSSVEHILNAGKGDKYEVGQFLSFICRLVADPHSPKHESILAGEAYLRNSEIDLTNPDNHDAAFRLQEWTTEVIQPTESFAIEPPFADENSHVAPPEEIARLVLCKEAGLQLLTQLQRLGLPFGGDSAALIACVASFTYLKDPWTNDDSHRLSQSLLSSYLSTIRAEPKKFDSLIRELLHSHIKPLFIKSKNSLLTAQARKAIAPIPGPNAPSDFEAANKPWKFQCPHVVTIFQWTLAQLDASLVEAHWPLIIPPLLIMLDDISTAYKIRGCSLLLLLLEVCPADLLERRGLGEVFHNTLMPYLLYLPSLTPEEESVPLLHATYDALLALTMARYITLEKSISKNKTLDAIFRYGVLKGYAHAGDNVRIGRLLVSKSMDLVNAMGIHCVKHLKDLLAIISETLAAPFATAYPPLLDAALQTSRAILINGWPRMVYHRGEILEGLVICWCRIQDEDGEPTNTLGSTKTNVEEVLRAVVQILKNDTVAKEELQMLQESDVRFKTFMEI
ncbi:MAG: hypothetical protein Q9208_003259 [Pyrenodesmia sp. 3 TL-2023]